MVKSLGLTTSFHKMTPKGLERLERKGLEMKLIGERGNGVVISKDWDPNRPTVLFCHGRDGHAGNSNYVNIPFDIGHHKFGGNCNIAIVLQQAPGNQDSMVADGLEAVDYLTQSMGKNNIRLQDMYISGYSVGCITAAALANCFPKAARLTLLLPPTSMPEASEHAFENREALKPLRKVAHWALRQIDGNDRHTVDYIARMHSGAIARGEKDVMPVEVLLSKNDKVADPEDFLRAVNERGLQDVVNYAVEPMHNSPTDHTQAFSLEHNFPHLMGQVDVLHKERPRVPPVRPLSAPSQGMQR